MTMAAELIDRREIEARLGAAAYYQDPYPVFEQLREQAPCYWNEAMRQWLLSRYADVESAFRSPERFSSSGWHRRFFDQLEPELRSRVSRLERRGTTPFIVTLDPPDHTVLRRALQWAFLPKVIEEMRASVQAILSELLDDAVARDSREVDLVEAVAYPLPAAMIASILGVPRSDRDIFRRASTALSVFMGQTNPNRQLSLERASELEAEYVLLEDYLFALIAQRRRSPRGGDVLSTLIEACDADGTISELEIVVNLVLFLSAGHETTTAASGNAIYAVLAHPEHRAALALDWSQLDAVFNEAVRWQSPVQRSRRIVAQEMELHGQHLQVGDAVELLVGAANRDPDRFEDADIFDPARAREPNIVFGKGLHFCIGAGLARLETTVAVEELLTRFPHLAFADDWTPCWSETTLGRSLVSLRLAFGG
jgi:cytochrome P450